MKHYKLFLFATFCFFISHNAIAKSACYKLATRTFMESSLIPSAATREDLKEANLMMADGETYCKRMVVAIKNGIVTSQQLRIKSQQLLLDAELEFQKNGDTDKLESEKWMVALTQGVADISDGKLN